MAESPKTRLDSWKAIADYLKRDEVTAIRWEKKKGLPVHRVPGGKRQAVFAYTSEIDTWMANGSSEGTGAVTSTVVRARDLEGPAGGTPAARRTVVREGETAAGEVPTSRGRLPTHEGARVGAPPLRERARRRAFLHRLGISTGALVLAAVAFLFTRARPDIKVLSYVQLTNDGRPKGGGLATDGARLYFVEDTLSGRMVCQVPTAGGEVIPLHTGLRNPIILGINPARTELLLTDALEPGSNRLYRVPLTGGEPQRLGTLNASAAAWSPDGQTIGYAVGQDLNLFDFNEGVTRRVGNLPGKPWQLYWSPIDRTLRINVIGPMPGEHSLFQLNAGSSNPRRMLVGWPAASSVSGSGWGSNGKYFLLLAQSSAGRNALFVLPEVHGILSFKDPEPLPLSVGPMAIGEAIANSNGRQALFTARLERSGVARFDRRSKGFRPVLEGISASEVGFSRDGDWVSYVGLPDHSLWKSRYDGSGRVQLTFGPMQTELPSWSPDGRWLAFMGQEPGQPWRVYLMSADTGDRRILTKSEQGQGAPTWSPDGRRIMFGDLVLGETLLKGLPTIHVYDLETHELSALPGAEGLWTARWSPDGSHVAALTSDSKNLMSFDFREQRWTRLATFNQVTDIVWSRRGDRIYMSFRDAQERGYVGLVSLATRKLAVLTGLDGEQSSPWLGLAPDDSVMIARDTSPTEIFALNWEAP